MMLNLIGISALSVFIYMLLFYLIAQAIKNNSIVDIGWGPGFMVIVTTLLIITENFETAYLITLLIIYIWGFRLFIHIFLRNRGKPEDFRYANWRRDWGKKQPWIAFYKVFMLQGFVMVVVALPFIFSFSETERNLNWLNYTGLVIFVVGFLFESIGDFQLSQFKRNKENAGKIITTGLWKYTRHPNYFGNALVWWGIYFYCFGSGFEYFTIVSPITMSLLLRFGSGVPMLEEKYQNRKDFQEYAKKTPVFIPFIGKKGL
jgi:steroid 5-alpha reductase family enzyme